MSNNGVLNERSPESKIEPVLFGLCGLICLAIIGVVAAAVSSGQTTIGFLTFAWASAFLIVGLFFGFLFCVPKARKAKRKQAETETSQKSRSLLDINTNLTEISDWLTKIIVGLGLVELKELPSKIQGLAELVAGTLKPHNASEDYLGVSYAILIAFSCLGFLLG